MNKKELEQKIIDIDQKLQTLGDTNVLIQNFSSQKQLLDSLLLEIQVQKPNIDSIPQKKQEIETLVSEIEILKQEIFEQKKNSEETKQIIDKTKEKTDEIQTLSLQQLGKISNEKLSNSFDKVKNDLKEDNKKWFSWVLKTSVTLLIAVVGIVIWQTIHGDTIFEISFLVKLALTSPIIYFDFFVSREYSRSKRLIEEYEFKSSIARSLEAYKEIIENLFVDKEGDEFKKKLDFILESIGQLYSSPMRNIKENNSNEEKIDKRLMPILSDIKDIVSDITGVVPKIK